MLYRKRPVPLQSLHSYRRLQTAGLAFYQHRALPVFMWIIGFLCVNKSKEMTQQEKHSIWPLVRLRSSFKYGGKKKCLRLTYPFRLQWNIYPYTVVLMTVLPHSGGNIVVVRQQKEQIIGLKRADRQVSQHLGEKREAREEYETETRSKRQRSKGLITPCSLITVAVNSLAQIAKQKLHHHSWVCMCVFCICGKLEVSTRHS